jgi:hypothetical protein
MKIEPELRERVLREAAEAGLIVILKDSPAERRIGRSYRLLRGVLRRREPVRSMPAAVRLLVAVAERELGIKGPGQPAPRGRFRPRRAGLADAARQLIEGPREWPQVFGLVPLNPAAVGRLSDAVSALQGYLWSLEHHKERAERSLWPLELQLYRVLSGAWKIVKPVFRLSAQAQKRYAAFYGYMTRRYQQGVATKKARQAKAAAAEAPRQEDSFVRRPAIGGDGGGTDGPGGSEGE